MLCFHLIEPSWAYTYWCLKFLVSSSLGEDFSAMLELSCFVKSSLSCEGETRTCFRSPSDNFLPKLYDLVLLLFWPPRIFGIGPEKVLLLRFRGHRLEMKEIVFRWRLSCCVHPFFLKAFSFFVSSLLNWSPQRCIIITISVRLRYI